MPRRLRASDEAVSPVVGTVIMVAVTLVLGASVYLVARKLTEAPPEPAPLVGLLQDDEEGSIEAVRAEPGTDWSMIRLTSSHPLRAELNGPATAQSEPLPLFVASDPQDVVPADAISFCSDGGPALNVRVYMTYVAPLGSQAIAELHFPVLPACL